MKDYVLVFTEGADLYNLEKQLKFFPESYIFRAPCSDDYYTLENCINEAKNNGFESFHWITMREDWAQLENELNKEVKGFKELKVVPATYGRRLRESDPVQTNVQNPVHSIVIFPYNLLKFGKSDKKPIFYDEIEKCMSKNSQFKHGFIPLSDTTLFGTGLKPHDVNCDEAYVLAYQYMKQYKQSLTSQFDEIWGIGNEDFKGGDKNVALKEFRQNRKFESPEFFKYSDIIASDNSKKPIRTTLDGFPTANAVNNTKGQVNVIKSTYGIDLVSLFKAVKQSAGDNAATNIIIPIPVNKNNHGNDKKYEPLKAACEKSAQEFINFVYGDGEKSEILSIIQKELDLYKTGLNIIDFLSPLKGRGEIDKEALKQKLAGKSENNESDLSNEAAMPIHASDPGFLSKILNASGAIKNGTVEPTEVLVEDDFYGALKSQSEVYNGAVDVKSLGHAGNWRQNSQFINQYHTLESKIQTLKPEELEKYQDVDYEDIPRQSGARPIDAADSYIFQILQLNNYNSQYNILNDNRNINFNNNSYTQIYMSQGWQTIGDALKKVLLVNQIQDDVKDTWADWAITGIKKASAYATNAGGYRDKKNQDFVNIAGALTKDPTKIPRPEDDPKWESYSDEEKQKKLDAYQKKVASSQALLNSFIKKRNDQMLADRNKEGAFNQKSYQLGNETQVAYQKKHVSDVMKFCTSQIELLSKDENANKDKLEDLRKTREKARKLSQQLALSDQHDYVDKDRRNGTEYNSANLDGYKELLGLAQNLGFSNSEINHQSKLDRKQAFAGTGLSKAERKTAEERTNLEMENIKKSFYALPEYEQLKSCILS